MTQTAKTPWQIREREEWTFGFASSPNEGGDVDWLDLLGANAELPGRVKQVVNSRLLVEMRFEAMEGESTESILEGENSENANSLSVDEILQQIAEAGWEAKTEDRETIRVLSEGNPGTVITGRFLPEGDFRFSLGFATSVSSQEDTENHQAEARALLLLRIGAEFRLVKPVFRSGECQLEVSFPSPGPTELPHIQHALGSLNIAAQSAQQEYTALANPAVAAAYLSQYRVPKAQN